MHWMRKTSNQDIEWRLWWMKTLNHNRCHIRRRKRQKSILLNYCSCCISRQKRQNKDWLYENIISFSVSVVIKDSRIIEDLNNYWCFSVQKARDTLNYCCYPESLLPTTQNYCTAEYWIITYFTVQKICRIFSTVYICNLLFLFAYKRLVNDVRRQKPLATRIQKPKRSHQPFSLSIL